MPQWRRFQIPEESRSSAATTNPSPLPSTDLLIAFTRRPPASGLPPAETIAIGPHMLPRPLLLGLAGAALLSPDSALGAELPPLENLPAGIRARFVDNSNGLRMH